MTVPPTTAWLFFGAGPFEAAVIAKICGWVVPDDKTGQVGFGPLDIALDALERAVTDHLYLAGDSFSAADVATGSQIGYGMHFGTIDKRPALEAYWARISERPALARARDADDAALAQRKE